MSIPKEIVKGQPITAHWLNELIRHVKSITPVSSPSIRVNSSASGTSYELARQAKKVQVASAPAAPAISDLQLCTVERDGGYNMSWSYACTLSTGEVIHYVGVPYRRTQPMNPANKGSYGLLWRQNGIQYVFVYETPMYKPQKVKFAKITSGPDINGCYVVEPSEIYVAADDGLIPAIRLVTTNPSTGVKTEYHNKLVLTTYPNYTFSAYIYSGGPQQGPPITGTANLETCQVTTSGGSDYSVYALPYVFGPFTNSYTGTQGSDYVTEVEIFRWYSQGLDPVSQWGGWVN